MENTKGFAEWQADWKDMLAFLGLHEHDFVEGIHGIKPGSFSALKTRAKEADDFPNWAKTAIHVYQQTRDKVHAMYNPTEEPVGEPSEEIGREAG